MEINFSSKLLEKIWEDLSHLFVFPRTIEKTGKAWADIKAYEMKRIAQAKMDVEKIRQGKESLDEDGSLIPLDLQTEPKIISQEAKEIISELLSRNLQVEIQRELNLRGIFLKAGDFAASVPDEDVMDQPADRDWLMKWHDGAKDISDDNLQSLWARILAGEIKSPNSYSLHTLEFLKRLSTEEAKELAKLAPLLINEFIFRPPKIGLDKFGISFHQLLDWQELGLMTASTELFNIIEVEDQETFVKIYKYFDKVVKCEMTGPARINVPIIKLSRICKELLTLGTFEPNQEYLDVFCGFFKNRGIKVLLGDFIQINDDGSIKVENPIEF